MTVRTIHAFLSQAFGLLVTVLHRPLPDQPNCRTDIACRSREYYRGRLLNTDNISR